LPTKSKPHPNPLLEEREQDGDLKKENEK